MFCGNCGFQLKENEEVCPKCGKRPDVAQGNTGTTKDAVRQDLTALMSSMRGRKIL